MTQLTWQVCGEQSMEDTGRQLAAALPAMGAVIFLHGDLGAGKTTLSRGLLRGLGHAGKVKSPTYTLVEEYVFTDRQVFHFDLYRLSDPEELEYMGHRDLFHGKALCVVEWPEKGLGYLPPADLQIFIQHDGADCRQLRIQADSRTGEQILARLGDVTGPNSA
ncbi:MAG: tRNA (adenosine(37)-N6)-threonylcarbamoyltransferase complex ATPase subunit type 1 TsaE [Gammaproteobacteria bacterium]|nr:tRNA (adenosine(37)-N6)-threonylcarbamoyltransferase complex ATPase subunit type 1 TsaE [Gammaproteobacteria bacterium]